MSGMENGVNTVTLRVNRFAPRAERAATANVAALRSPEKTLRLGIPARRRAAAARQAVVAGLHVERASGRHGA